MARLNEILQPAAESIDALKRRFVRQNRDLARVNSTQSIRIRNLECEFSSLQSENVSLRGRIIKLQNDLESNTNHFGLLLGATKVKLQGLIDELPESQGSACKQLSQKRKSLTGNSPPRSPSQRRCKTPFILSELPGERDGRLSPILEDKYYPRRTLDAEHLLAVSPDPIDTVDSPDLGPPPVAHFDEGEPIQFDANHGQSEAEEVLEDVPQMLPANLETRKKRREDRHQRELNGKEGTADYRKESTGFDKSSRQTLKSGAKRKLGVRVDLGGSTASSVKDEFHLDRIHPESEIDVANGSNASFINKDESARADTHNITKPSNGKDQVKKQDMNVRLGGRKPLGSKSVNSNPQSPVKSTKEYAKERGLESKRDMAKHGSERSNNETITLLENPTEPFPAKLISSSDDQNAISIGDPPETPGLAGPDLISPQVSEPSARPTLCDTPPPPDLGDDDGNVPFGRASRRPRGSVNYAQPNLRDKMRRPTRELVDAVSAEARTRQSRDSKVEGSVKIKQEEDPEALGVWRTKPFENVAEEYHLERRLITSPLENKTSLPPADLPASVKTDRKRVAPAVTRHGAENDINRHSSGASSTIAALTSGNQTTRTRQNQGISRLNQEDKIISYVAEGADIYDITSSTPGRLIDGDKEAKAREERAKPVRSSRRHSTVAAASDHGKGLLSISRGQPERKREGTSVSSEDGRKDRDVNFRHKTAKGVTTLASSLEENSAGRGERAASRRRSMML